MVRKCSVPGCTFRTTLTQAFPHPVKDGYKRFNKWIEVIGNEEFRNMDALKIYHSKVICRDHFTEDCFVKDRGTLKKNAVPNKNLPAFPVKIELAVDLPPTITESEQLLSSDEIEDEFGIDFSLPENISLEDSESQSDSTEIICRRSGLDRLYLPVILDNIEIAEQKILIDESGMWAVSAEEYILPDVSHVSDDEIDESDNCVILITNDCLNSFIQMERDKREEMGIGRIEQIERPQMKRDYSRRNKRSFDKKSSFKSITSTDLSNDVASLVTETHYEKNEYKDAVNATSLSNTTMSDVPETINTNEIIFRKRMCPKCFTQLSEKEFKEHFSLGNGCHLNEQHLLFS